MATSMYHLPYKNLAKEGLRDVEFFSNQRNILEKLLATKAFGDLETAHLINDALHTLKGIIRECKTKQNYFERMQTIEHTSYIIK